MVSLSEKLYVPFRLASFNSLNRNKCNLNIHNYSYTQCERLHGQQTYLVQKGTMKKLNTYQWALKATQNALTSITFTKSPKLQSSLEQIIRRSCKDGPATCG